MDQDSTLRRAVRLIAGALLNYARINHLADDDFRWYYRVNSEIGQIHLVIVLKGLLNQDYHLVYKKITSFLRDELAGESVSLDSIGIALWDFEQYRRGGFFSLGPEYQDFRDYWAFTPVPSQP